MEGAREYAELFETGQIERLYIVSGNHARGKTFHIFVLPPGEKAVPNGPNNPPLNPDAVEVYGVISGQPGWTEHYGWIHRGRWEDDFQYLVNKRIKKVKEEKQRQEIEEKVSRLRKDELDKQLLSSYQGVTMLTICRGGNGLSGHRTICFDGLWPCPLCKVLTELAEYKADLTELNLKMAPDYEGIIESRREMKEERQKLRDEHPELILEGGNK